MTASNVKVGGVDFVADVMNNLDRSSEKNIFDRLAEYNEPLADEIRKRMFVFEDIVTMDDRSVQRFVRDLSLIHIWWTGCASQTKTPLCCSR